jgi:hypothetical protein
MGSANGLMAQSARQTDRTESLILDLQKDPNTRQAVTLADKALIEQALSNPDFAERLAQQRGPVYVMMHGITYEPIQGITVAGKSVQLIDKAELLEKNPSTFFILKDLQRTSNAAFVDLVMHYDFDGNYTQGIGAQALMERVDGQWEKQELATKIIR